MRPRCAHATLARTLAVAIAAAIPLAAHAQPDDQPSRQLLTANAMLNRGLYDLALPEYEAFLEIAPGHADAPTARYGLGVCLYRLGRHEEAAAQLQRVADDRDFEFAAESSLLLGHCRLALADLDDAADRFQQTLDRHADHAVADDAGVLLAEAMYRARRYAEALDAAERAASAFPDSPRRPRAELLASMSQMALKRHADALTRLEPLTRSADDTTRLQASLLRAQCLHTLARHREALGAYEAVLDDGESPHQAEALLGAAQIHHAQGRPDRASRQLDRLDKLHAASASAPGAALLRARIALDAGDTPAARRSLERVATSKDAALHDDAAYWLAKCDLRDDRFDRAAAALADAMESHPKSPLLAEMRYDRAVALARDGDEAGAFTAFEDFRRRHPEHALAPEALRTMASIRHRDGDHERALALADEFMRAHPDNGATAEVAFVAAESEFLLGRDEQAAQRFADLIEHHPDAPLAREAALRLGLALDRLGRFDEAEPHLLRAVQAGDAPAACLALGQGYFDQGRWTDAEAYLRRYLRTEPDDAAAARLRLALAQARDDRPEDALATLDRLLASSPGDDTRWHAHFERAQALRALDRPEEAQAAYQRVVDEAPDSRFVPHALERLGALALDRGDTAQASDLYARAAAASPDDSLAARAAFQRVQSLVAAGDHATAAEEAARFLDAHPDHTMAPATRVLLGVALSREGRTDEALAAFESLDDRAGAALAPAMRDTLAYETALALRAAGRTDDAADAYARLIERADAPDLRAHAMLDLAGLAMDAGNHERAVDLLRQALDLGELVALPDDLVEAATYRLGVATQALGHHDEAIGALATFADRWPASPLLASADLLCAESMIERARFGDATTHLRRAVQRAPGDDTRAPALLRLAQAHAALTRWPDSERTYATFLEDYPDSELAFRARFGLAFAVENQGRHAEAIEHYQRVVSSHEGPTAARAQFQIGECHFALADHERAVRELLRVDILYDYPEWSAAALYEAGRCFEAMAKTDEARAHYTQATERFPDSEWAALAAQRLDATNPAPLPGRGD